MRRKNDSLLISGPDLALLHYQLSLTLVLEKSVVKSNSITGLFAIFMPHASALLEQYIPGYINSINSIMYTFLLHCMR